MIGRTNAVIAKSGRWPSADEVQVTYTGTMADPREITDAAGNKYVLYELTSSGTLTVDKEVPVEICLVQGGGRGRCDGSNTSGGQSGKILQRYATILSGSVECVVGAVGTSSDGESGGASTVSFNLFTISSELGGRSGAGGGAQNSGYTKGDGIPTYVFGDTSVYDYPICAGGGGGLILYISARDDTPTSLWRGGSGGSNGGDGGEGNHMQFSPPENTWISPPEGGNYGGGHCPKINTNPDTTAEGATDAFTYGSGGGGGARWGYSSVSYNFTTDTGKSYGEGMQGVIFIRILK